MRPQIIMRRTKHRFEVEKLTSVTSIIMYWQNSLELGVVVFGGLRMDMTLFKAVLSVLGTVVPILLTRILAQWTGAM